MSCMPSTTETTQNKGRRTYRNDDVCIQPNFMNHTYQTTNQTSTTQTTKTTTSTWVSPLTQNLCSYNWDNANSGVFVFKFQPISKNSYSTNFVHFMHHQFVHFIDPENLYVYWWTISYISSIPTWIRYQNIMTRIEEIKNDLKELYWDLKHCWKSGESNSKTPFHRKILISLLIILD